MDNLKIIPLTLLTKIWAKKIPIRLFFQTLNFAVFYFLQNRFN